VTEVAAGRKRLAEEATTRRALRQLRVGDDLGLDSSQGRVVAIGHDGEGDPLVVPADSRGRRQVITLGLACHRHVTLRTRYGVDGLPDIFCCATDVAP
jgi:hypothetical protein